MVESAGIPSPLESLPKLRPVGFLERCSTHRHHISYYFNVAVSATYTAPASFSASRRSLRSAIYAALASLIRQHPVLSAVPVREGQNDSYFARLPSIDLSKCVAFRTRQQSRLSVEGRDEELEALLQNEHNRRFELESGTIPAWRVVVLTDASVDVDASAGEDAAQPGGARSGDTVTVVWVYHHALGDGGSGLSFHRAFLHALNSLPPAPSTAESDTSPVPAPDTPLLPPLDSLHKLPLSVCMLVRTALNHLLPGRGKPTWTGGSIQAPVRTHLRTITVPVTPFLAACRREKTTITAALGVLTSRALFDALGSEHEWENLSCCYPVSMRRWLDGIDDSMIGVWVTAYDEDFSRADAAGKEALWERARRSRAQMQRNLEKKGSDSGCGQLKLVANRYAQYFDGRVGKKRTTSFEISNVGVFRNEHGAAKGSGEEEKKEPDGWTVRRAAFTQCASVTGAAFELSVVSVEGAELVLGVSWQEDVVEEDVMAAFCEKLESGIREASEPLKADD